MDKLRLTKKAIAIIVIVVVLIIGAGCFGATYGILHRKLKTPCIKTVNVTAEPDYIIELSWDKISGAHSYTLEYRYSLYPDVVHTLSNVSNEMATIKMIKGNLEYRIKAIGKYSSNTSDFSAWCTYMVNPLTLDQLRPFNFTYIAGEGIQINMDTFTPVTYVYKGNQYVVNYYEIDALNEEELRGEDDLQPQAYSISQLEEGLTFHLPQGSGTWRFYIRPVLYVEINGVKDYTQAEGLYELYDENINYIIVEQTV